MDNLIHFFQNISSSQRAIMLAGGITLFWIVESFIPLFHFKYNKWKHAAINIFFTLTTIIINFAFALLIVKASEWSIANNFGILQWISMPLWLQIFTGLLLLDLIGAWLIHFIQHKTKWMWKFHLVHHADTHVDTTTANRHHPIESVFRAVFTAIAVFVIGAPVWMFIMYQTISAVLSQCNHANIKMNKTLDKILCFVFVTPNMHRVHHHYKRPETDTNFGNIFSLWDRIFGTYCTTPVETLKYGLDVLIDHNSESIATQLKIPFNKKIKTDY